MIMNDIIEILKKEYKGNITSETTLSEIYGPDKLGIVELEVEILKKFKVDINAFHSDINTVDDLCKLVEYLMSKKQKNVVVKKDKPKKQKVTFKQFVESAKQILRKNMDNLDTSKVYLTTYFYDIGADSLEQSQLAFDLEMKYDFVVPDNILTNRNLNFGEFCRIAYMALTEKQIKQFIKDNTQKQRQ